MKKRENNNIKNKNQERSRRHDVKFFGFRVGFTKTKQADDLTKWRKRQERQVENIQRAGKRLTPRLLLFPLSRQKSLGSRGGTGRVRDGLHSVDYIWRGAFIQIDMVFREILCKILLCPARQVLQQTHSLQGEQSIPRVLFGGMMEVPQVKS